jgi:hypothetical protein
MGQDFPTDLVLVGSGQPLDLGNGVLQGFRHGGNLAAFQRGRTTPAAMGRHAMPVLRAVRRRSMEMSSAAEPEEHRFMQAIVAFRAGETAA